ncbi:hypothetical protein [Kineosporia corallincola]|uniref:hypothetical protein n=1 Tax=Kineosporia corallincola TaxID=2835133 RepID=UPI001FE495A3|nr:hypothetical protein [Kineosporia corallincola]
MQPSSLVLLAIVAVWAAYLVPHWVRRRDELSQSRTPDRFSGGLRVLKRRERRGSSGRSGDPLLTSPRVIVDTDGELLYIPADRLLSERLAGSSLSLPQSARPGELLDESRTRTGDDAEPGDSRRRSRKPSLDAVFETAPGEDEALTFIATRGRRGGGVFEGPAASRGEKYSGQRDSGEADPGIDSSGAGPDADGSGAQGSAGAEASGAGDLADIEAGLLAGFGLSGSVPVLGEPPVVEVVPLVEVPVVEVPVVEVPVVEVPVVEVPVVEVTEPPAGPLAHPVQPAAQLTAGPPAHPAEPPAPPAEPAAQLTAEPPAHPLETPAQLTAGPSAQFAELLAQPAEPSSRPAEPPAQSVEPPAQSVEPLAQPAEPAPPAEPARPRAEVPVSDPEAEDEEPAWTVGPPPARVTVPVTTSAPISEATETARESFQEVTGQDVEVQQDDPAAGYVTTHADLDAARLNARVAARRRARTMTVLLVTTAVTWVFAFTGTLAVFVPIAVTLLLSANAVASRTAAVRSRESLTMLAAHLYAAEKAREHAENRRRQAAVRAARAAAEAEASRQTPERAERARRRAAAVNAETWEPIPVPLPTYQLKPAVHRPLPPPVETPRETAARETAARETAARETAARETAGRETQQAGEQQTSRGAMPRRAADIERILKLDQETGRPRAVNE